VLRSHCGGQRYAVNWGLALVTAVMDQRKAEASYGIPPGGVDAVAELATLQPAEPVESGRGHDRAVVGGELERGVLLGLANLATALG
jgi:putative transposase